MSIFTKRTSKPPLPPGLNQTLQLLIPTPPSNQPLPFPGLKKLFKGFDADGSGTITVKEMKRAMESWGHKIPDVRGVGPRV